MRALRTLTFLALLAVPAVTAACGDEKKPEPAWTLPSGVADLQGGPIGEIVPPAQVVAWGGADDVDRLAAGMEAFARLVVPALPRVLDAAEDELRRRLAMTKVEGVDWKRPARFAVFDPKGMPRGQVALVLALASREKFLASIPPTLAQKKNDDGNAVTYRDELGRTVCFSFVDDAVVITWDKKQFAANAELFVRLARSTIAEGHAVHLSVKNISTLYAKEIEEIGEQARAQATASPAVSKVQAEATMRVFSWMMETWKELDRVEVLPKVLDDGVLVSIRLHPQPASKLAGSFKAIEPKPHTLIQRLPADTTMFASFSTNPDAVDGLTTQLVEWAMSVGFGGHAPEGYAQAVKDYFAATGGQIALAAHKPFSGEGLTLTTLLSVRDEEKLRSSMRKSKAALKDKATLENDKKMGVLWEYKENAARVGTVPVDTTEVRFEKGKNPLSPLGPLGDAVSELFTNHMAVSGDLGLVAYGKDGKKSIEAFLGGKVEGGLDKAAGPARALRLAAASPVGILYVSPVEIVKRASLGGQNPIAASLADLGSTTGVALSFSARDGVLEIVLDVPGEQARTIAQGLARAKALMPR